MNKVLYDKILEAFSSVLPITAIVLIASVVLVPIPAGTLLMFIIGAILLIIGMGFFTMGADMAMMPIGEGIGIQLTRSAAMGAGSRSALLRGLIQCFSLVMIIVISFVMGMIITIAEPDLQVLANQVPLNLGSLPHWMKSSFVLVLAVAAGVGFFLVVAVLRVVLKVPLSVLLIFFYLITFLAVYWAPASFIPVAFDSGGVTTGPMTVPFILAMGVGVASIRGDKGSQDDSFGLVSLCSIGPILAVLGLGIVFNPEVNIDEYVIPSAETSREVAGSFAGEFPHYTAEVMQALAAIVLFFLVFQFISRRYKMKQVKRIGVGFAYTLVGLVVFLTGVNVGFIPVGHYIGDVLASGSATTFGYAVTPWILVPFGMLVGYYIVSAEPAVHVLNKQVEAISSGAIPQKAMAKGLAIGMAAALALTMTRILLKIDIIYILIPGYALAIIMTFFVPKIFVGIAFDSGGVCSGPMTSTFLLPLAMGVCTGSGGDLMKDAFGIVAMVAMAPLIVIQIMGLVYRIKTSGKAAASVTLTQEEAGEIIIYERSYEGSDNE
ncbi:MAG: DUF1538 domain-containing protein [Spirochaetaceae bacterium]|jgi:hypothetical protein|nr:DUF1538 domain-containing protein [Spirochaetaceae bacterium]